MRRHDQCNPASDKPSWTIGKICARLLSFAFVCYLFFPSPSALGENFCIDYQYYPKTNNLRVYDFSILSPYCQVNLSEAHALGKKAYAYISAGEIAGNAQYYQAAEVAGIPFVGRNPNWDSLVVDLSSPLWAPFVIAQLAAPAVRKGYDGFFLDTMDSYYLADPSLRQAQETGLVNLVKKLKAAYPTKKIIINRGFPVFSRLVSTVDGMLVEGLFYSYPGTPQDQEGTEWLLGQIAPVKAAGKAVYIVDYLSSALAGRANETAQRIQQLGFNPLISGPNLDGTVLAPVPPKLVPRIERFAFKSGIPTVTFTALKGMSYSLETIQNGEWIKVKDVTAQTTTRLMDVKDTSTNRDSSLLLYRLVNP